MRQLLPALACVAAAVSLGSLGCSGDSGSSDATNGGGGGSTGSKAHSSSSGHPSASTGTHHQGGSGQGGDGTGAGAVGGAGVGGGNASTGATAGTGGSSTATSGTGGSAAGTGGSGTGGAGGFPTGWLYTSGAQILASNGAGSGTPWMGRGVNIDDLYLCGNNYHIDDPSALGRYQAELDELMNNWKPNFLRVSLGMDSYPVVASWVTPNDTYKTPMTSVIKGLGAHAGTYVLVTLRTDVTMAPGDGNDPEPTKIPAAATDAVYAAIVDSFANDGFVLFGLSNEPGGNAASATEGVIRAAMDHAVGAIRAHEDAIGVPHHIVSVQANHYTGDASMWSQQPLTYDNVVYEVHGYPPPAANYTFANIPVIIGEYGGSSQDNPPPQSLIDDFEAKQLPNLAWDYEQYSNCGPDLLDTGTTGFVPTKWGALVKKYLNAHAP